jgi:hypothetical protein
MKQKAAAVLIAKLRLFTALCQPFLGEDSPKDPKAAHACYRANLGLQRAIHQYDLVEGTKK